MKRQILSAVTAIILSMTAFAAKVDTISVASQGYLETPMRVAVITPESARPEAGYRTVYLLNGYSGDHRAWLKTQPRLPELADQYGMVIVMPDGRDSWYWDSPVDKGMQMESFITKVLVPYVNDNYDVDRRASHRAITGLSMGGHGALWLSMRHPDIFGNAGSMSGGVDIRPFPKSWKMAKRLGDKDSNPELWERMTVINLVDSLKPGTLNITFDCGRDDFFAKVNNNLHERLDEAGIAHDYTVRPGAHTHKYWGNSILYHLLFFNEAFKAADAEKK